jgi:response regulator RpfG family c-di-GMP phosphodiesterase
MHQITSTSESISICVLDNDPSALQKTTELLSSAGRQIEPFVDRDAILNYAESNHPAATIVDFCKPCAYSLDIAARLKAISPSTSVIISLRVRRGKAHNMLMETEQVNLIKERCVQTSEQPSFEERPTFSQNKEIDGCWI